MIAHVTAAALASENKSLAHPASVDSLPTSANQEDHVSMATFAARRLGAMLDNTAHIVGIELLAAAQGIEFLRPLASSRAARARACAAAQPLPVDAHRPPPRPGDRPRDGARRGRLARPDRPRAGRARGVRGLKARPALSRPSLPRPSRSRHEARRRTHRRTRRRLRRARAGNEGRHRHLGLDRLRAAHARQGGGPVQEARARRRPCARSRRRTATSPSPRATSSARRRRSRRGSSGTRTACRPRRSSSSTRATAPTAWW